MEEFAGGKGVLFLTLAALCLGFAGCQQAPATGAAGTY